MCFSAGADFAAAAGIGAVGVATLAQVRRPRLALFAALPLLFAGHQLTEGFVWLGMDRTISAAATRPFMYAFMLYAQAVLPLLIALAVLLVEPRGWRRAALAALVAVGVGLCAWGAWALAAAPSTVTVEGRCLTFRNPITNHPWTVLVYAGPACLAPLISSRPWVRLFGALNLLGMVAVLAVKAYALTSVWCLYAACVSVMLFWAVRGEERPFRGRGLTFRRARAM